MTDASVTEAEWRRRMVAYRLRRKPWAFKWGPPPGEPGCLAPPWMLNEARA